MNGWIASFCVVALASASAGPPPDGEPSLAQIPAWLREHVPADQTLKIALIGCRPDGSDPRLASRDGFRLVMPERTGEAASRPDTELAAWMSRAWDRVELSAAPIAGRGNAGDPAEVARAMVWALEGRPVVMHVPIQMVNTRKAVESRELADAIAMCWRRSCLVLTVGRDDRNGVPPGILRVVAPRRTTVAPDLVPPGQVPGRTGALRLPVEVLADADAALTGLRGAVAYLVLATASLPAEGPLAHLERASRLGQVTPLVEGARGEAPHRLIDVRRSLDPGDTREVVLGGRKYAWSARVREITRPILEKAGVGDPDEVDRRVLTGLRGDTPVRHLAALAELADARTILLIPQAEGIAVFRANRPAREEPGNRAVVLMETLQSRIDERFPFYSVARDAVMVPKARS